MLIKSQLEVRTGGGSYQIKIGRALFSLLASDIAAISGIDRWAVVADSNVARIHAPALMLELKKHIRRTELFEFPAGESGKTRETKQNIEDMMQNAMFGRDCALIALGGGVAGDLGGFVAATYCRGIPYIQVPTTLVACVDSAVGGKTGVDTPAGKNLIGAFHQPAGVYADISLLSTLETPEIIEGVAEVIKYGVIKDPELFAFLEKNMDAILKGDEDMLFHIVERSCSIKADVVEKDERESDLRKILNFGHTVGHAVEKLSGYSISHGRAVAIGMVSEARISQKMGFLSDAETQRIENLIKAAGLPARVPDKIESARLFEAMKLDKKARSGRVEMALPRRIGEITESAGRHSIAVDENLL